MHDIRLVREDPRAFDALLARRGLAPMSAEILAIDAERRARLLLPEHGGLPFSGSRPDIRAAPSVRSASAAAPPVW